VDNLLPVAAHAGGDGRAAAPERPSPPARRLQFAIDRPAGSGELACSTRGLERRGAAWNAMD